MSLGKEDLRNGSISGAMLRFAFPLMLGNLLQQCYNIADTLIVGRVLGADGIGQYAYHQDCGHIYPDHGQAYDQKIRNQFHPVDRPCRYISSVFSPQGSTNTGWRSSLKNWGRATVSPALIPWM